MLITKRTAGLSKRGSKFVKKNVLNTRDPETYTWLLKNDYVEFYFKSDEITGAKLASFNNLEGSTSWVNSSRSLWILNTIKYHYKRSDSAYLHHAFRADIYPTKETFVAPSLVPTVLSDGTKVFEFVWSGIKYNKDYQNLTCSVTLTASLGPDDQFVDLSLSVESEQPIAPEDVPGMNRVVIQAVHFPKFIFKESGDAAEDNNLVFAPAIGHGVSITRPAHYLRSVRTSTESYHFNPDIHRVYFRGQPLAYSPTVNLYKANYGSPGWMSMPCIVYGNRESKEGFLIYARDPDGCHAKGWQWFSDDKNLHIRTYDVSDHELDPYGMGGKYVSLLGQDIIYFGNQVNNIGWTLRIRPFVSPTKWVDWYGYKIYREEEVQTQEDEGRISPSFYNRSVENDIDIKAIECPIMFNTVGPITGDGSDLITAVDFWQNELKNLTYPPKEYDPQFTLHIQPHTLNAGPRTGLDTNSYHSRYYSWERWANQPLGDSNYGPSAYQMPDGLPFNDTYSGIINALLDRGIHTFVYNLFPFNITSGSEWAIDNSGFDLAYKSYAFSGYTIKASDWYSFARVNDFASLGLFATTGNDTFGACFALDINYDKHIEMSSGFASAGVCMYHDTAGSFGRGCYANTHIYKSGSTTITLTHPRGKFTHYYNSKQKQWIQGTTNIVSAIGNNVYDSEATSSFALARASEFNTDALLPDIPVHLYYGVIDTFQPILYGIYNTIRSDEYSRTYSASTWPIYSVGVQAPAWNHTCPSFNIAYGDRSITNYWAWPHFMNLIAVTGTIPNGPVSGLDPVTQGTVYYPQTIQHEICEWASWFANDIGWVRRVTVSHQPRDYWELIRGTYSGLPLDHSGVCYNSPYSGYFNYLKEYLKLSAHEPDYIYHGGLEHPIDNVTVLENITGSDFASTYWPHRHPSLHGPDYSGKGLPVVIHNVYRKRDSDNLLITLTNWQSGNSTISGYIEATTYDIDTSYELYRLDPDDGTKTLIDVVPANYSYPFTETLSALSWSALEIVPTTDISTSDFYSELAVSYSNIRYSYTASSISSDSIGISYSYGTEFENSINDPLVGFDAPMTQQIVNNLPQWTATRQKVDSNGWKLVNAWGSNLENLLESTNKNSQNIWLATSNTDQKSKVYKSDIPYSELVNPKPKRNLLYNSSFSILDSAIYNIASGWASHGTSTEISNNSIVTNKSIKLYSNSKISQTINVKDQVYYSLTASCYLKSLSSSTDIKLLVRVEHTNGNSYHYSASLYSRSDEWKRLVLPIALSGTSVRSIRFYVVNKSNGEILISAPQLEIGNTVTSWSSSLNDSIPFLNGSTKFNQVSAVANGKKIPIFGIASESDFIESNIPTRIEKTQINTSDINTFKSSTYGRKVDFYNQTYEVEWGIRNNYIVEISKGPSKFDYFNEYKIRDLRFSSDLEYGTRSDSLINRELLALCIKSDILYCVTKEIYSTTSKYVLKILKPLTPTNQSTYLESLIDFDLNLNQFLSYNTDETITEIKVSNIDTKCLELVTNYNRKIYYKLYYDYYYVDNRNNQMYTLENYKNYKIQVI